MQYKERGEAARPNTLNAVGAYVTKCYKLGSWPYEYVVDDPPISHYPYLVSSVDNREWISYEVGRGKYNNCTHVRHIPFVFGKTPNAKRSSTANVSQMYSYPTRHDRVVDQGYLSGTLSFQTLMVGGPTSIPSTGLPSADWADLVGQVGSQLDGHMLTSQNLLVSIAQVMQVVGMFKNPYGLLKLQKLARRNKLPLGELVKAPANAWLEHQFGWKNLVRDIDAIANVWTEVRKHKEYLKSVENKFASISARNTSRIDNPSYSLSSKTFSGLSNGSITIIPKISKVEASNCFSLDVYRQPGMAEWSNIDHILTRLGVRGVAEALWDLVPFSFVVDWFTHINRDVRRASIPWEAFKLRYVGYSRKIEWHGYVQILSNASTYWGNTNSSANTNPQVVQKSYQRVAGFPPDTSSVGLFGSLSKTQLADLAALIVQRT